MVNKRIFNREVRSIDCWPSSINKERLLSYQEPPAKISDVEKIGNIAKIVQGFV